MAKKTNETEYKVNGSGTLKSANIDNVCTYGKTEDIEVVLNKAKYALEQQQEVIDETEHGFDIVGVDLVKVNKDLKSLKRINATKQQIKKAIKVDIQVIEDYNKAIGYRNYLTKQIEKLEKAMG